MDITICIGSSCHLKGSREIVQQLEGLVEEYGVQDKVGLNGSFCMGNCVAGVCTKFEDTIYSLTPQGTRKFFEEEVLRRL